MRYLLPLTVLVACTAGCHALPTSPSSWFSQPETQRSGDRAEYTLRMSEAKRHEQSGKWDRARKSYRDVLAENPNNAEVHHRLAVVADRQKRYEDAQQFYTIAIQLDPKNAQLFNDLGYCFFLQGQLKKAERALDKAVALDSGNARFRNNLGMVCGHQERMEEAYRHFTSAGGEADAFYNIAFIYATKGNDTAAQECFKLALDADPLHEKAKHALTAFQRDDAGDPTEFTDDNIRRVRYVEGEDQSIPTGQVQTPPALSNRNVMDGSRALHARAQTLMQRRMASQRNQTNSQSSQVQQAAALAPLQ
ncbi:MAG: tetratricopeptide repeat protein [Pirellulaceae bacterium]|jgi:Tfp pilus assembly protein PilF|nr:tetratricopeptide repeat protein [Pirellulaceae bacterium]MDP7015541.1 tetratricopeptide repeat protein [Pirellulaceae bacterium]